MKLLRWPLGPLFVLLFPDGIKRLGSDNLPTIFIQFLSVIIGSGVSSAFIFGVHADHWWVLSNKSFWVKTLLQCLLSELSLLSFLEFLQVKLLGKLPLFIIILVSLKLNNDVEDFSCLSLELIRVHGIKLKGLQSDAEGNLLLLLQLLLGLCHFPASIATSSTSNRLLLISSFLTSLLGFKHFFSCSFFFVSSASLGFFSFSSCLSFSSSSFFCWFSFFSCSALISFLFACFSFSFFSSSSSFSLVFLHSAMYSFSWLLRASFCFASSAASAIVIYCDIPCDDTAPDVLNRVPMYSA